MYIASYVTSCCIICRCRCKSVTHAQLAYPIRTILFVRFGMGGRQVTGYRHMPRVFPLILFPFSSLVIAASPRGNRGPCTVRRSHRRKLYPTCRQSSCMTMMAFPFGIAWDTKCSIQFGIAIVRVWIRRSGTWMSFFSQFGRLHSSGTLGGEYCS